MMKKYKASTLVEIVIYFTLLAVFLGVATSFSIQIIGASHSASNESNLATELSLIRSRLTTEIQSAESIDLSGSVFNDPNGVLSLNMEDVSSNPTSISLSNGDIQIQYGTDSAITLNSSALHFASLQFQVFSSDKTPDHVILDAVVNVETDLDISDATSNFHLALSLRP